MCYRPMSLLVCESLWEATGGWTLAVIHASLQELVLPQHFKEAVVFPLLKKPLLGGRASCQSKYTPPFGMKVMCYYKQQSSFFTKEEKHMIQTYV